MISERDMPEIERAIRAIAAKLDPITCDDLAQEAITCVWRHRRSFRHEAKPSTYAYRVLQRLVISRSRRRASTEVQLRTEHADTSAAPSAEHIAIGNIAKRELIARIRERLSPMQQTVIVLRSRGMSCQEIADHLTSRGRNDATAASVRGHLYRARVIARSCVEGKPHG